MAGRVDTDRPVLVIAEGLLMYLADRDVHQLLAQLTQRFSHGKLPFDAMAPWVTKLSKLLGWALNDPHELEREHPGLVLIEHARVVSDFDLIPAPGYRACYRLMNKIPIIRNAMQVLHYQF